MPPALRWPLRPTMPAFFASETNLSSSDSLASRKTMFITLRESFSTVKAVTGMTGANAAYLMGNVTVLGDADASLAGGDGYDHWKDSISDYTLSTGTVDALFPAFALATSLW